MNDETPDSSVGSGSTEGLYGSFADTTGGDDTEQYLLNDIGVALRLLSEKGSTALY